MSRQSLTVPVTPEDVAAWSIKGVRGQVVFAMRVAQAAGFRYVEPVTAEIAPDGTLFHFAASPPSTDEGTNDASN